MGWKDSFFASVDVDPTHLAFDKSSLSENEQIAIGVNTSVSDVPSEEDRLGVKDHVEALARMLRNAKPPLTISIQGNWGSGKTTVMQLLRDKLCEAQDKDGTLRQESELFKAVWIRSWEYAFSDSPSFITMQMIRDMSKAIGGGLISDEIQNKLKAVADACATIVGGVGVKGIADRLFSSADGIKELKNSLEKNITKNKGSKKGFIFFIDDLDRLPPKVAVQFLELTKNIFDIKDCIFVLAIDYQVVIKGLEDKFGKYTQENDHEFRAFFDKIIQFPFRMPVYSYNLEDFTEYHLRSIGYLNDSDMKNTYKFKEGHYFTRSNEDDDREFTVQDIIYAIIKNSIGSDPRGFKRICNSLSYKHILAEIKNMEFINTTLGKLIVFCMTSIQNVYPNLFDIIVHYPRFLEWDEMRGKEFSTNFKMFEENLELGKEKEFDELWEKVLYGYCYNHDKFMRDNVFKISKIMNILRYLLYEDCKNIPKYASDDESELENNTQKRLEDYIIFTSGDEEKINEKDEDSFDSEIDNFKKHVENIRGDVTDEIREIRNKMLYTFLDIFYLDEKEKRENIKWIYANDGECMIELKVFAYRNEFRITIKDKYKKSRDTLILDVVFKKDRIAYRYNTRTDLKDCYYENINLNNILKGTFNRMKDIAIVDRDYSEYNN